MRDAVLCWQMRLYRQSFGGCWRVEGLRLWLRWRSEGWAGETPLVLTGLLGALHTATRGKHSTAARNGPSLPGPWEKGSGVFRLKAAKVL